jgi:hypothetical protein
MTPDESDPSKESKDILKYVMSSMKKALSDPRWEIGKGIEESMRESIKSGVEAANRTLANLEETSDRISKPVVSTFHKVEREGRDIAQQVSYVYTFRHDYAPYLMGGSFLLGGLLGLRRGKIPAAVTASMFGFISYLGVYQVDIKKLPEHVFGKK